MDANRKAPIAAFMSSGSEDMTAHDRSDLRFMQPLLDDTPPSAATRRPRAVIVAVPLADPAADGLARDARVVPARLGEHAHAELEKLAGTADLEPVAALERAALAGAPRGER